MTDDFFDQANFRLQNLWQRFTKGWAYQPSHRKRNNSNIFWNRALIRLPKEKLQALKALLRTKKEIQEM